MHLKHKMWRWIEKWLMPGEQRPPLSPLALRPKRGAELSEMQELIEALEAMPAALSTLPWRKERLWPAIRAALQTPPTPLNASRWARGLSLASLLMVFCGVWWGSMFNAPTLATAEVSYIARPQATPQLPATPPRQEPAGVTPPRLELPSATPLPLPAPAQTPILSRTIFTGTVTPGG